MNKINAYILPKERECFSNCDDNFSFNEEKLNFAVCDGSSSDFFSKLYSRFLSDKYSEFGGDMFRSETISELNNHWRDSVKLEIEKAGCRPGSFPYVHYQRRDPGCSTLVCLSFNKHEANPTFDFYALGDSVAFFIPKGNYIPELQISSDSNDNYSFNTDIHFGYTPPIASSYSTEWLDTMRQEEGWPLKEGTFIMVTDAIAEWLLRNDGDSTEEKFKDILAVDSQEKFISYVKDIRDKGAHMDDMTLVIISIDDTKELVFSQENIDKFDYRAKVQQQTQEEELQELAIESHEPTVEPQIAEAESQDPAMELQKKVERLQVHVKELEEKNNQLQKENEVLKKKLNEEKKKVSQTRNLYPKKQRNSQKKRK